MPHQPSPLLAARADGNRRAIEMPHVLARFHTFRTSVPFDAPSTMSDAQQAQASREFRAAVLRSGRVELAKLPRPAARAGTHLVRVTHALITPFEREVVRGLRATSDDAPREEQILGCAFVGVIEDASRSGDERLARGARVAVQPVFACGLCDRCDSGLSLHCQARMIAGLDAPAGGLAEFAVIPAANCVELPAALDDERAVFAVPLARAIEAVRRGGIEGRSFASVLGDDLFAILAAIVGREENPLTRLVSSHPATLELASQFGLRNRALSETGRRGDQELVIDMTGSTESAAAAARMVRPRGHVVFGGISTQAPAGVDLSHLALDEIEIYGSGFGAIDAAIELLTRRAIDPAPLITRRVVLADAPAAIAAMSDATSFSVLVQVTR
jgi:threonine dehydrogenase-like Zn-dependent dehydrogenase